jgi:hypothetical protein
MNDMRHYSGIEQKVKLRACKLRELRRHRTEG